MAAPWRLWTFGVAALGVALAAAVAASSTPDRPPVRFFTCDDEPGVVFAAREGRRVAGWTPAFVSTEAGRWPPLLVRRVPSWADAWLARVARFVPPSAAAPRTDVWDAVPMPSWDDAGGGAASAGVSDDGVGPWREWVRLHEDVPPDAAPDASLAGSWRPARSDEPSPLRGGVPRLVHAAADGAWDAETRARPFRITAEGTVVDDGTGEVLGRWGARDGVVVFAWAQSPWSGDPGMDTMLVAADGASIRAVLSKRRRAVRDDGVAAPPRTGEGTRR